MSLGEVSPSDFADASRQLGADLVQPGKLIDDVVSQLNVNLVALGCEVDVPSDYIQGSWRSYTLTVGSQPFSRAVRATTHAIIYREENLRLPPTSINQTLEETMDATTEGAVWIDPQAAAFRKRLATQNAGLLICVREGLASAGYPQSLSKRDMRQEFDEILDGLWTRGSYNTFSESKVIADTMKAARIRNMASSVHGARRFTRFASDYGFGLALTRLFPEELLS